MDVTNGRITLYVALSLDGYIATEDGGVDWLDAFERETEEGNGTEPYERFLADVDCLLMGSRTYEQILGFGDWPYGDRPTYVLTGRDLPRATGAVTFVDGSVRDLAAQLTEQFDHIWLVGGALTAQTVLGLGLIDEFRLHFVPVLLGRGLSLFGPSSERRDMTLLDTTRHDSGIVELRYE